MKDAVKRPGALRRALGVKEGKNIPKKKIAKAAKAKGRLGRQARLAQVFERYRPKKKK